MEKGNLVTVYLSRCISTELDRVTLSYWISPQQLTGSLKGLYLKNKKKRERFHTYHWNDGIIVINCQMNEVREDCTVFLSDGGNHYSNHI